MKQIFILALFIIPAFCTAQTKPPKLRIQQTFFSTRYELGDKTTAPKAVALHLKQHNADAYIKWRAADRSDIKGLVWSLVGLGGVLVGVLAKEPTYSAGGYLVGAVGVVGAIGCQIGGNNKRQKAIDLYNNSLGY